MCAVLLGSPLDFADRWTGSPQSAARRAPQVLEAPPASPLWQLRTPGAAEEFWQVRPKPGCPEASESLQREPGISLGPPGRQGCRRNLCQLDIDICQKAPGIPIAGDQTDKPTQPCAC